MKTLHWIAEHWVQIAVVWTALSVVATFLFMGIIYMTTENKLPWHSPEQLMGAWTPTLYPADSPPYVNVTQVGSMVRVTVRGDNPSTVTFVVNAWWFDNLVQTLKDANSKFECGLEDRIFKEHTGKDRD